MFSVMKGKRRNGVLRKLQNCRGTAFLEVALFIPLWVLVMFSIMDLCTYTNAKWDTMAVARSTVRYGSLKTKKSGPLSVRQKDMNNVQDSLAKEIINSSKMEEYRKSESERQAGGKSRLPYPGDKVGDIVYSKACVKVHMNIPWNGKTEKDVCSNYMMMRMFEG